MPKDAPTLESFLACRNQADIARLLGRPGKGTRDITRRVFGVFVNRGDPFDTRLVTFLHAYHVTYANDADAGRALGRGFRAGDATPDAALERARKERESANA